MFRTVSWIQHWSKRRPEGNYLKNESYMKSGIFQKEINHTKNLSNLECHYKNVCWLTMGQKQRFIKSCEKCKDFWKQSYIRKNKHCSEQTQATINTWNTQRPAVEEIIECEDAKCHWTIQLSLSVLLFPVNKKIHQLVVFHKE